MNPPLPPFPRRLAFGQGISALLNVPKGNFPFHQWRLIRPVQQSIPLVVF